LLSDEAHLPTAQLLPADLPIDANLPNTFRATLLSWVVFSGGALGALFRSCLDTPTSGPISLVVRFPPSIYNISVDATEDALAQKALSKNQAYIQVRITVELYFYCYFYSVKLRSYTRGKA